MYEINFLVLSLPMELAVRESHSLFSVQAPAYSGRVVLNRCSLNSVLFFTIFFFFFFFWLPHSMVKSLQKALMKSLVFPGKVLILGFVCPF
jgi:hypothetical protein